VETTSTLLAQRNNSSRSKTTGASTVPSGNSLPRLNSRWHYERNRSSGEQRGIAGKVVSPRRPRPGPSPSSGPERSVSDRSSRACASTRFEPRPVSSNLRAHLREVSR
jgi:hypothetical protein